MKFFTLVIYLLMVAVSAELRVGFYNTRCPQAESTIRTVVERRFRADRSVTAALLRMHFHDCFVRGCDASILIDGTANKPSEKSAGPNFTVREYELIDQIKAALETQCPSVVSCADIVTLATRDSVALAGGPRYNIPTGRRDGLVSNPQDVGLPGPDSTVPQALQVFTAKGMTLSDMIILLGAHTVGISHCNFFQNRLSNFRNTGAPDPSMDPGLVATLRQKCGTGPNNPSVFLDQGTPFVFDNEFYNQILRKRGILRIDQELALDSSSFNLVSAFAADGRKFATEFARAMVKLGSVEVLVDSAGEIRKNCRAFNQAQ